MSGVQVGAVLQDRYQLTAELGRGGMGAVYRAHDTVLDRQVAIKVLSAPGLGTEGRQRMLREAQAIAKLNHSNIVQVHDAGQLDDTPFIIMELVEGQNLHDRAPRDLPTIVGVARQICAALEHAHQHGIIHRDLKPENVILEPDGSARLMDFGLARSVASRLTTEGEITGTVFYLAPELALGQDFDGRADLYSLGVMLYELTTGELPFSKGDPLTVISQHVHATPVAPQARNSDITARLEHLILRLLNKRPDDRPETATALLNALDDPELLDPGGVTDREQAVLRRVARGHFVGRQRELKQARSVWLQAQQGRGQALLISGEPGIGKSRLTRELATQAEISGGRVLVGECYPEGGVPYSPFAQMLRRALHWTSHNGSDLPDFVLADLLSLAPDLRPYYPNVPENPPLDPESQQQRLFESVVTLCTRLSEQAPLFLAIEDAHWADSGSLALFRHLARRTKEKRAMVVATYREVELGESRPLQEMLVDLNRERLADRLKLGRFDREATRNLLAAIFEEDITPEFLDRIYAETEGNPFFIEELCKALVEEGKLYFENGRWHRPAMEELDLPQSVRVAIQSRLAKLSDPVQDVLRMAAVLGHEFDFETLAYALEQDEDLLIEALETAERSQLIEELNAERGGTFRFGHALIASTLAEDLSGLRRRRMHGRAAEAIRRLRPDDFETLAYHYSESGDLKEGLAYSLKAGERALRFSANNEALRHYTHALEIAEAEGLTAELVPILEAIGEIEKVGDFNKALAAFERAMGLTGRPDERARLNMKIGNVYVMMGNERALPMLQEAVEALDPQSQAGDLARATASIGRFYHNRGQHRRALEHLQRAYQIAEPLQEFSSITYTLAFLAGAHQHLADFEGSMNWARRMIELGQRTQYMSLVAVGHEYLSEDCNFMGRWEEALDFARTNLKIGQRNGLLERIRWAKQSLMWALHGLGRLPEAIEEGRQALQMAETNADRRLAVLAAAELANALADVGELDEAGELADRAVESATELNQAYMTCEALDAQASLRELNADWQGALELRLRTVEAAADTDNRLIPMINGPGLAEAYLELGQLEQALEALGPALQIARESDSPIPEARSLRVRGRINAAQGDWDQAVADFSRAVELCEQWKGRLLLAQVLLDWGRLQADHEGQEPARATLERALELFTECGAEFWVQRTRAALADLERRGGSPRS
ncbi:MAG TPA: protein kinase [Anaerolineales bacterium]